MFLSLFKPWLPTLPSQCQVCRAWPADTVCEDCIEHFGQPTPRCRTCAMPVPDDLEQCGTCRKEPPPLDRCLAALTYGFPWSDVIGRFKFREQPGLAGTLAQLVRSTPWVEPTLEAADLVLPMPLATARLKHRGFNQAKLLASHLAPAKTQDALLLRIKETQPQSSLKRPERLQNMSGAFRVVPQRRGAIKGKRVVLVDDVMTSGASLFSAAQTLRQAGATHIAAVVIARTE